MKCTLAALLALGLLVFAPAAAVRADFIYSAEAYGAFAPGLLPAPAADTGPLPAGGGSLTAHLDNFNFMNVVTSGALDAHAMGAGNVASADASIARFHADLRPLQINFVADADLISSQTRVDGSGMGLSVGGSITFTNFVLNGTPLSAAVPANTRIDLAGVGFLVLNEQTSSLTGMDGSIMLNAVHVHLDMGGIDIFLAHAESGLAPQQGAVPEPATWLLLVVGFGSMLGWQTLRPRAHAQ